MDHRKMKLSRRSLLQGLGSLAIISPLARVVSQAQAAADTGPLPRLLLISAECAGSTYWWRPPGNRDQLYNGLSGLRASSMRRSQK
jgi:hypothetical protein